MFHNDSDALAFLEPFKELPKDVWLQILTAYQTLSVSDIERMCRVSKSFNELCSDKDIWRRILEQEVNHNQPVYEILQNLFPNDFKRQVMANRIFKTPTFGDNNARAYIFKDGTKILYVNQEVSGFANRRETTRLYSGQNGLYVRIISPNTEVFRIPNLSPKQQIEMVLRFIKLKLSQGVEYKKCEQALCNNLLCVQAANYKCGETTFQYCSEQCAQQDYFFKYQ
jgi:hypothetical protein